MPLPLEIIHNQDLIIKNLNAFFKDRSLSLLRLNNSGICLALALTFLRQKISLHYDPKTSHYFESFLKIGSTPERVYRFYSQFNSKLKHYQAMPLGPEKEQYRNAHLALDYDILAVIDQALMIYAVKTQPFYVQTMQPQMHPGLLKELNLCMLSATSVELDEEHFSSFFKIGDIHSPFVASGQYLLILNEGHVIALTVHANKTFSYYDPHLETILTHSRGLNKEKNNFFKMYKRANKTTIKIDIFSLESNQPQHQALPRTLLVVQAVRDHMRLSSEHYLSTRFNEKDPFFGNMKTGHIKTLYYADNPYTAACRQKILNWLSFQTLNKRVSITTLLNTKCSSKKSALTFIMAIFLIANRTGNIQPIQEILERFGPECVTSCDLLYLSAHLNNWALFQSCMQHVSETLVFTDTVMHEANQLAQQGWPQIGTEVLRGILLKKKQAPDRSENLVLYLARHEYFALIPLALALQHYDLTAMYHNQNILDFLVASPPHKDMMHYFIKEEYEWSFAHVEQLMALNAGLWIAELLKNERFFSRLDSMQLQTLLEYAIDRKQITMLHVLSTHPSFVPHWTYSMISELIHEMRTGQCERLHELFEHSWIQKILSSAPGDLSEELHLKTFIEWLQVLKSLSRMSVEEGDQKILTSAIKANWKTDSALVLQSLLRLPHVAFKPQDIVFDSKPLLYHVLSRHDGVTLMLLMPHVKTIDLYSKQYFIQYFDKMISDLAMNDAAFFAIFSSMQCTLADLLKDRSAMLKAWKHNRPHDLKRAIQISCTSNYEENIADLMAMFEHYRQSLFVPAISEAQLRISLEQIQWILYVWDALFVEGAMTDQTTQRILIEQWKSYCDRGIEHLVKVWRKQGTHLSFQQLVGWRSQCAPAVAQKPQVAQHRSTLYQRMMQFVSGWR